MTAVGRSHNDDDEGSEAGVREAGGEQANAFLFRW